MKKSIFHHNNKHLFIIGAQRCGTTSILNYLKKYKKIKVTKFEKPEPKYFTKKNLCYDEYLKKYFGNKKKYSQILVEKSTSYIEIKKSAENIKKIIKCPKILIMLRNPAERCVSNYLLSKKNNFENYKFLKALSSEKKRFYDKKLVSVSPFKYYERGLYLKYLSYWYKIFKKSHIKILILEKISKDPNKELQFLCDFLDIKFNPKIKFKKMNHSKKHYLHRYIKSLSKLYLESNKRLSKKYNLDLSSWTQ